MTQPARELVRPFGPPLEADLLLVAFHRIAQWAAAGLVHIHIGAQQQGDQILMTATTSSVGIQDGDTRLVLSGGSKGAQVRGRRDLLSLPFETPTLSRLAGHPRACRSSFSVPELEQRFHRLNEVPF